MNTLLHSIQNRAKKFGMLLNIEKTLLVTMNKPEIEQNTVTFIDGTPVKRVNTAIYLGITCNEKATQTPNLNKRLGAASEQFNRLHLFWRHTNITQKMKIRFFKQIFYPMVLYGLEYSAITPTMERKLDAWQARHLRRVLNIKASMISHTTNQTVLNTAKEVPLSKHTYSKQLKYMGHVLRTPQDHTEYTVCFTAAGNHATISGKKRVGRPKHHWAPNTLQNLAKHRFIESNTLHACLPSSASLLRPFVDLAHNRKKWANLVAAPTRTIFSNTTTARNTSS